MTRITVACLDMAGTTVADDGTVLEAFAAAVAGLPGPAFEQAMTDVRSSMGQSKIEVFRRILGDETAARKANEAFEDHYAAAVRGGAISAVPGPRTRSCGCVTRASGSAWPPASPPSPGTPSSTSSPGAGLSTWRCTPPTRAFGRGRPWPDLPLTALLRLRGGAVGELAVAGDTASDIESGRRAGAGIVAGVLTGASTRADLEQAGAPLILDTIAGILTYIVS